MAAQELGGGVHHDIGAVLDRAAEIGRGHGVVDHQRNAGFVRDGRDLFDIEDVHARIGDGLAIDRARVRRDGFAEVFRVVRLHEFDVDAQAAEADVELRVGAAVERAGGDDLVALPDQAGDAPGTARPVRWRWPEPATPPSSAATRCSKTSVVGFMMRL